MKKKLVFALMLFISLFKIPFNYSMNGSYQDQNSSTFDFDKLSKLINWQELANLLIKITLDENPSLNLIDVINLVGNQEIYKLLQPSEDKITGVIANFIPLSDFSHPDKVKFLENNKELVKNILKCALNFVLAEPIKSEDKKNISKALIYNKASMALNSKDFKNIVLGFGSMTTLWLLSHAFCHQFAEILEPQQLLSASIYVFFIFGTTYFIVNNILQVTNSKADLAFELLPNVLNWVVTKTEFGQNLKHKLNQCFK